MLAATALPAARSQREQTVDIEPSYRPYHPLTHTVSLHEAMKTWPATWAALPLAGTQVIAADPEWDCPEERYELRTCPCGSTLCKRVA